MAATPRVFSLLTQAIPRALFRACCKAGSSMEANMAMMAMTTSSSISVKEALRILFNDFLFILISLSGPASGR